MKSGLWETFITSMRDIGYTASDLQYCSDDLFLTIAEETGQFNAMQIGALFREWRQLYPAMRSSPSPQSRSSAILNATPMNNSHHHHYPVSVVHQSASQFLHRIAAAGERVEVQQEDGIIAVEPCPADVEAFSRKAATLKDASVPTKLVWKFCSPATLTKIKNACATGTSLTITNEDDADALCRGAIVLYTHDDVHLHSAGRGSNTTGSSALHQMANQGWALVGFDVAPGRARRVTADEAGNLGRFSMAQCLDMLVDADYDSLLVTGDRPAVLVCHARQLLPRCVVFFQVFLSSERRLEYSGNGLDTTRQQNSSFTRAPPSRGPPAAVGGNSTIDPSGNCNCDIHPQKQVEFWSPTEHRLLCSHCLYYEGYSRDNCVPIEQGTRLEVPRLERWVANASTFSKEVHNVTKLFQSAAGDIRKQEDIASNSVASQFAHLREKLNIMESDILSDIHQRSSQRLNEVEGCQQEVEETVNHVTDLIRNVEAPLRQYKEGATDNTNCLRLLRTVQRAMAKWSPIHISGYTTVRPLEGIFAGVESALAAIPTLSFAEGKVELPEAIDVNYLKLDSEATR